MPFLSASAIAATKVLMDLRSSQIPIRVWDRVSEAIYSSNEQNSSSADDNQHHDDKDNIARTSSQQQASSSSLLSTETVNRSPPTGAAEEFISSLEPMFAWLQAILLWHDRVYSFFAINCLTFMFLIISNWAPRFYSSIMLMVFCYNFSKLWFCYIWPEIRVPTAENHDVDRWTYLHPHLLTLPELMSYVTAVSKAFGRKLNSLAELRSSRPGIFCALVCATLGVVTIIGNCFRGTTIVYFVVISLATAPGIYLYVLPQNIKEAVREYFVAILNGAQASTDPYHPIGDGDVSSQASTSTLPTDHLSQLTNQDYSSSKKQSYRDTESAASSATGTSATDKTLNWIKTGMDVSRSYFDGISTGRKSSIAKISSSSSDDDDMLIARGSSSSCDEDEFEIISETELLITPTVSQDANQSLASGHRETNLVARYRSSSTSSNKSVDLDLT